MPHPLVDQLRFTRSEWLHGLEGVTEEDGAYHAGRMNSISWMVGHLAWQEHRYWLNYAQGKMIYPQLNTLYAYRAPMSTPSLNEMRDIWGAVTKAADPWLDALTTESLLVDLLRDGESVGQTVGSAMRRMTYHYWIHIGEIQAIRQMLDHPNLYEYVGDLEGEAPYRPESGSSR